MLNKCVRILYIRLLVMYMQFVHSVVKYVGKIPMIYTYIIPTRVANNPTFIYIYNT